MYLKQDILLCDLDAFYASVEQVDQPKLQGKPVIIGGNPEGRGVVSTCSYEARKYGIRSAMPMKRALELCPHAVALPVNMNRYKELSNKVLHIFGNFTPDILPVSIDEAYLGLNPGTGCQTAGLIRVAAREELGLPISIGVSVNLLLAKISCELAKPDNIKAIWPADIPVILWPLPVEMLPGVGPSTQKKLNRYAIKTIRDLAKFPKKKLLKLLGNNALTLINYANGHDDRRIVVPQEAKSISKERTFPQDVFSRDHIVATLYELSGEVGYHLRSKGVKARTVSIKIRFADFTTLTRDKTLYDSIDLDTEIYNSVKQLFISYCGKPPWRLIGVKVSNLERWKQMNLLSSEPNEDKERKITVVKDKLRNKYGYGVIYGARKIKNNKDHN